ncbi:MAG TPA: hypothetical protein GXX70_07435 [Tepidimicrobium sp.]|nr:hypothetical protein [Tepidimicrobium sp.]
MNTLLVLGVNDGLQHFYIAAYDMDDHKYVVIRGTKDKHTWDMFSVVKCKLVDRKHFYDIKDEPVFTEQMGRLSLKEYLKDIKGSMIDFMLPNSNEILTMVSVDRIEDIVEDGSYVGILLISGDKTYQFKVADRIWLQNWEKEEGLFKNGKDKGIANMNRKDRDVYVVVYRAHLNKRPYIIAIHSL